MTEDYGSKEFGSYILDRHTPQIIIRVGAIRIKLVASRRMLHSLAVIFSGVE